MSKTLGKGPKFFAHAVGHLLNWIKLLILCGDLLLYVRLPFEPLKEKGLWFLLKNSFNLVMFTYCLFILCEEFFKLGFNFFMVFFVGFEALDHVFDLAWYFLVTLGENKLRLHLASFYKHLLCVFEAFSDKRADSFVLLNESLGLHSQDVFEIFS